MKSISGVLGTRSGLASGSESANRSSRPAAAVIGPPPAQGILFYALSQAELEVLDTAR